MARAACSAPYSSTDVTNAARRVTLHAMSLSDKTVNWRPPWQAAGLLMQGWLSSPLHCWALLPPPPAPASTVCW